MESNGDCLSWAILDRVRLLDATIAAAGYTRTGTGKFGVARRGIAGYRSRTRQLGPGLSGFALLKENAEALKWRLAMIGLSGFALLKENAEALKWRLAMIDHAERSIDMQYYLWERDEAGLLLIGRLLDAAERGVRVRVLVDDFLFHGDERRIAALSHHPNLEIKIFNPRYVRRGKVREMLEFGVKFKKLNRRMHNKVFVADNRVAIVGGRNVGYHYFGLSQHFNFVDLEVLTAGAVVREISRGFDVFWNSEAAYPAREMAPPAAGEDLDLVMAALREEIEAGTLMAGKAGFPLERKDWTASFEALPDRFHQGTATFYHDEPGIDPKKERTRFLDEIPSVAAYRNPKELMVISPYLIPRDQFLANIETYTRQGARVRILAPSMGANNQAMVHSHYRQYRRKILERGAELYELREDGADGLRAFTDTPPARAQIVGLHLKGFVRDRRTCFIGSLNMDPRSVEINTEGGLWIESPGLANEVADHFEFLMEPDNACRVTSETNKGTAHLIWRSRGEVLKRQPAPSGGAQLRDFLFGLLPIRRQL